MFPTLSKTEIIILVTFTLSSAKALNLVESKTLMVCKGLVYIYFIPCEIKFYSPVQYLFYFRFDIYVLAPLAKGQRAIVMVLCRSSVCPSVPLSVRPSVRASINSSFKKLVLGNYSLDFYEISQECSLGGPLSNSFK